MQQLLALLTAIEPALEPALKIAAVTLVPLAATWMKANLDDRHQRLVYDIAKASAKAMNLFEDMTPTRVDNAAADILELLEEQLGKPRLPRTKRARKAIARRAVVKHLKKMGVPIS
jgi:hypothetical protein